MKNRTSILFAMVCMLLIHTNLMATPRGPKKDPVKRPKAAIAADVTKNLEYDFSRSSIRTAYYGRLDKLAQYLIDNKAALTLRGYADSIGSFKGNWKLSEKRAVMVKGYLVKKGVADDKIVTTAFGSTVPVATNATAKGRQRNRRVEIKVSTLDQ